MLISRKIWFLEEVLIFQKAKSEFSMNFRLLKNIRDIQFTVKPSKRWWQKKSMDPCQKSENFARENHQIQPQTCFFFTWNAGLLAYLVYRSRKTFYIWRFFDILKKCMKNVLFNQNYEVLWCEYLCQKGTNLKNLNWQFQKVLLAKSMNDEKFSEMMNVPKSTAQCANLKIVLPPSFYVKSNLPILESQKLPIVTILRLKILEFRSFSTLSNVEFF